MSVKETNIDVLISSMKRGYNNGFSILAFFPINKSHPLDFFVFGCISSYLQKEFGKRATLKVTKGLFEEKTAFSKFSGDMHLTYWKRLHPVFLQFYNTNSLKSYELFDQYFLGKKKDFEKNKEIITTSINKQKTNTHTKFWINSLELRKQTMKVVFISLNRDHVTANKWSPQLNKTLLTNKKDNKNLFFVFPLIPKQRTS